jgi:peptidoglycan/xylan/chitin deacetylase (PgdA/CDA1 family)
LTWLFRYNRVLTAAEHLMILFFVRAWMQARQNFSFTNKAVVSFVFDDGTSSDWNTVYPLFQSYGIPGSSAIICQSGPDYGWANAATMQSNGWEFLSHTVTHAVGMTTLPANHVSDELSVSQKMLKAKLGPSAANHCVWPGGTVNAYVCNQSARFYGVNRGVCGNSGAAALSGAPVNNQCLAECDFRYPQTSLAAAQSCVDLAASGNKWLVFYEHNWVSGDLANVNTLLNYIKTTVGIPIMTVSHAVAYLKNPVLP